MNQNRYKYYTFLAYLILIILGLYHHEMWRDEYEEYLQARDAEGLLGLSNTMSQGHAMLWQGFLWIITRFTHNPIAMKLFHGLIAASFAWVLIFKSPFKLWQSGMLLLSYFLLFEYSVISRCYAFGVLFFFLFAYQFSLTSTLNYKTSLFLFLLANTSVYAMMLTAVLAAWLLLNEWVFRKISLKDFIKTRLFLFVIIGSGILLSYLQISPNSNNSFPVNRVIWPFNVYRFNVAITQFFSAFVPISKFNTTYFWNTNFLMNSEGLVFWLWPLLAFIIVSLPLVQKPKILLLWLAGTFLLLFFQYHTGFRFARYFGHFFIWWIVCMWLNAGNFYKLFDSEKPKLFVLILVISVQAIGGISMMVADWDLKFSRGAEVAEYLKYKGYSKNYMIGSVDFALSPIAAELDRKIYSMQHKQLGSFTKWDKQRLNSMDSLDLVEALESGPANEPIIFIASHPIPQFQYFKELKEEKKMHRNFQFNKYNFYCLAYFKPGIEYYEGYWIFKVEKQ